MVLDFERGIVALNTQNRPSRAGVLAALKGAWGKVASRRPFGGTASSDAELQSFLDEASVAAPTREPVASAPVEQAVAEPAVAEETVLEKPVTETVPEEPVAEEPAADAEPVSEPLEVASPEAAKAIRKPAAKKAAKAVAKDVA